MRKILILFLISLCFLSCVSYKTYVNDIKLAEINGRIEAYEDVIDWIKIDLSIQDKENHIRDIIIEEKRKY